MFLFKKISRSDILEKKINFRSSGKPDQVEKLGKKNKIVALLLKRDLSDNFRALVSRLLPKGILEYFNIVNAGK